MKNEKEKVFYGCWAVFQKSDKRDYPTALFMNLHDAEIFIEAQNEITKVPGLFYLKEISNTLSVELKEGVAND